MTFNARLLWTPYPYRAGFCITDDPDGATMAREKAVYDFLLKHNFKTTKAVWTYNVVESSGIPPTPPVTGNGITLQDKEYLAYIKSLHSAGFEICLHGASGGNNTREMTKSAFEFVHTNIGKSDTFICHSKNADNLYWEKKVTLHPLLRLLTGLYSHHNCSGEQEASPYYWGDLCRKHINQIRLYRTRRVNTLAACPSMPYFDPRKPLVNGWFSATKRRLADCLTLKAIDDLKKENGLCVLYQYMHGYANPETFELDKDFCKTIETAVLDKELLIDTVSKHMKRLRSIQGLFMFSDQNAFWVGNASDDTVKNVQIQMPINARDIVIDNHLVRSDGRLEISEIPPHCFKKIDTRIRIKFSNRNYFPANRNCHIRIIRPFGTIYANLSDVPWCLSGNKLIKPQQIEAQVEQSDSGIPRFSQLSSSEEVKMFIEQAWVILKEVLRTGRSLNANKYLGGKGISKMQDYSNW
jgi:hypothetical protein